MTNVPLAIFIFISIFAIVLVVLGVLAYNLSKKVSLKMAIAAFCVPAVLYLWYTIETSCCHEHTTTYSSIVGFGFMLIILPLSLLAALAIPERFFALKKDLVHTIFLTATFGLLMPFVFLPIISISKALLPQYTYFNPALIKRLSEYDSVIQYIEDFKADHGTYPETLAGFDVQVRNYPFYEYITYNDKKDFVLHVSNREITKDNKTYGFRYCSSVELPQCMPEETDRRNFSYKIGNWVHSFYIFDD